MYRYKCKIKKCGFTWNQPIRVYNLKVYPCLKCWNPGVLRLKVKEPLISRGLKYKSIGDM
jgi:hypothetical protein